MAHLGNAPQVLSKEEFYKAVRDLRATTAVFDYDGTLWPGDAGSGFMRWTIEQGVLSKAAASKILDRHAAYHRGEVGEVAICGEMVQIYSGIREDTLRASAHEYFQRHVRNHLFPEMASLVQEMKQAGAEIWAVSSTSNWVIEAGIAGLGIAPNRVLATCVSVENGVASETLIDVPSDEGKAAALRRAGLPRPDAVFGNSVHDAAMLEMARQAFPVNPSEELFRLSAERGWAVYYPAAILPAAPMDLR